MIDMTVKIVFSFWERVFTCKKNSGSFISKNIDFCCYEEVRKYIECAYGAE